MSAACHSPEFLFWRGLQQFFRQFSAGSRGSWPKSKGKIEDAYNRGNFVIVARPGRLDCKVVMKKLVIVIGVWWCCLLVLNSDWSGAEVTTARHISQLVDSQCAGAERLINAAPTSSPIWSDGFRRPISRIHAHGNHAARASWTVEADPTPRD